jgi:hypothetical protein
MCRPNGATNCFQKTIGKTFLKGLTRANCVLSRPEQQRKLPGLRMTARRTKGAPRIDGTPLA